MEMQIEQVVVMFPVPLHPGEWCARHQYLPTHGSIELLDRTRGWQRGNIRVYPEGVAYSVEYAASQHDGYRTCIVAVLRPRLSAANDHPVSQ